MAKKPDITTIASGYYSRVKLNENFENLRNGFDNTLSLDGSTPNAMQADLDFNNNNAVNIASLDAQTITLGGSSVDLSDIQSLTNIAQDIQTLADIEDGTEATDAIQTAASVSSDISVVSGISSDVTSVSGVSADVTTVAGISSDVSTVASNVADVTNFADVYLGPAASAPVTRNDGSPLQEGDLYFNTSSNLLFVYNGSDFQTSPTPISDFASTLLDDENPEEARQTLELKGGATTEFFDDVTALLADTNTYTAGTIIRTRNEGFAYEAVASGGHITNAGGQELNVLSGDGGYNVKAFGAVGDGTTDDTAAIQTALAAAAHVLVPQGEYVCDSMVEIDSGQTLALGADASLIRKSASSASTDPVVWLKSTHATLFGSGWSSLVRSENRAPNGVVRVGHKDLTESHSNVLHCAVAWLRIGGAEAYGQTTGDPDQALVVYNPQFSGLASYFHHFTHLRLVNANTALGLHGWANANKISEIEIYRAGNATADQYRKAIHINGAQENEIRGVFHHFSPDAWSIVQERLDNTGNGGSTHTPGYNRVVAICEQGGSNARPLVIPTSADGGSNNVYQIGRNTARGVDVPSDFTGAVGNRLDTDENIDAGNIKGGTGEFGTLDVTGVATFDTPPEHPAGARSGQGQSNLPVYASLTKSSRAAGAATVAFTFSNQNLGPVREHGFIRIAVGADNSGVSITDVAWYLCFASVFNEDGLTSFGVVDSGGNTGTFTLSFSGDTLTISTTKDKLVATVEYANTASDVGIT